MRRLLLLSCLSLACATNSTTEGPAQPLGDTTQPQQTTDPRAARMDALSARIDAKRQELGIPGLALVVVKDGQVLLSRGFGERNVADKQAVDEDTLFAIGSTTKAFTAMLVMMAVDEGKISLDDHPRKCVPYFKLLDEKADKAITVRDLLTHSSGLMRTDLGWITGRLSAEETIRVAGLAKATGDLGEKFQYQNVMYAAAGECVANLYGKPYSQLMAERFFAPLGMTHGTNISVAENLKNPQRAVGYTKAGPDQVLMPVPMRPIDNVAPAGAINTSIRDIAPWLKLMLAGGAYEGKKLVSETSFRELTKTQQKIRGPVSYTLGWMRDRWKTHRQLHHGGGIDGFVTLISLLPKDNVGFALFTNIQNGDIHGYVTEEVYGALLEDDWGTEPVDNTGATALPESAKAEVGRYGVVGGVSMEVVLVDNKLTLKVPRQPAYELIPQDIAARKYRLGPPAPSGYYATFRPRKDDPKRSELLLEQPQGPMTMARLTEADFEAVRKADIPGRLLDILGLYANKKTGFELEVGMSEGRVALLLPGQDPAPLVPQSNGFFSLDGLPETFKVEGVRTGKKISGLKIIQPGKTLELEIKRHSPLPKVTPDQLMQRMRKAANSQKLAKLGTFKTTGKLKFVNQGLEGSHVMQRAYPNKMRETLVLKALGKDIGTIVAAYNGTKASQKTDFTQSLPLSNEEVNNIVLQAAYDSLEDHANQLEKPEILRSGSVGDEATVVVRRKIKTGGSLVMHVSTKTWLLLKIESYLPMGPNGGEMGTTVTFADYRKVSGIPFAHKATTRGLQGEAVLTIDTVELGAPIDSAVFQIDPAK